MRDVVYDPDDETNPHFIGAYRLIRLRDNIATREDVDHAAAVLTQRTMHGLDMNIGVYTGWTKLVATNDERLKRCGL